jgi:hypothetical protein
MVDIILIKGLQNTGINKTTIRLVIEMLVMIPPVTTGTWFSFMSRYTKRL